MDNTDIFDSVVMGEEIFQQKGYEEGVLQGEQNGYNDGFQLGLQQGKQIGAELGFYQGFAEMWLESAEDTGIRTTQVLSSLVEMIKEFPTNEPENQSLQDRLGKIRAKFKQATALLHINVGTSKEDKGLSF